MKGIIALLVVACCLSNSDATLRLLKQKVNSSPILQTAIQYLAAPEPGPTNYARPSYSSHVSTFSIAVPAAGAGVGSGIGAGIGSGIGAGIGPGIGAGVSPLYGAGIAPGIGAGVGPGIGPLYGAGIAPGIGAGVSPLYGAGIAPGIGAGVGPGIGAAVGPVYGAGIGPGIGAGVSPGIGAGIAPGFGAGVGPGFGTGIGSGIGQLQGGAYPFYPGVYPELTVSSSPVYHGPEVIAQPIAGQSLEQYAQYNGYPPYNNYQVGNC